MTVLLVLSAAVWVLGAAVSAGAIAALGARSDDTWDDSFSGSFSLDLWIVALWPIFWLIFFSWKCGEKLISLLVPKQE